MRLERKPTNCTIWQLSCCRSELVNLSEQMNLILESIEHWEAGHMSDEEMIEVIAAALTDDELIA